MRFSVSRLPPRYSCTNFQSPCVFTQPSLFINFRTGGEFVVGLRLTLCGAGDERGLSFQPLLPHFAITKRRNRMSMSNSLNEMMNEHLVSEGDN